MASEASRKKAAPFVDNIASDVSDIFGSDAREFWIDQLAAALDAARAEGVAEGEQRGAERKRSGVERAWLIESRFTPAPTWWTGTDYPAPWTRDSLKAVRFCRKCDAEAAMAALQDGHFCFASEHQWGLGPMRGPEEE